MSHRYLPEAPEDETWDVIVVGTGMGGGTLGYALSRRGVRVLLIEKGLYLFGDHDRGTGQLSMAESDDPHERLRAGRWPTRVQGRTTFGEYYAYAPLGCGTGGTTGLYGAQLERLLPSDFAPRRYFPEHADSTLPEQWPIRYEELLPYYRQAEKLYRVAGTDDELHPDPRAELRTPPPLSPLDQCLFDSFKDAGLHPYRAHAGFEHVPGCDECPATLCPRACKSDSGRLAVLPAIERGAKVLPECEAVSLEADATRVTGVRCRYEGREIVLKAKHVALALGALRSPVLMLRSRSEHWPDGVGNRSGLVGRNLMFHVGDFIAVRPRKALSAAGPKKAISLNDFYVHEGTKLGTFQSIGAAVSPGSVNYFLLRATQHYPLLLRKLLKPFLRIIAHVAARYFARAQVMGTILEDLPYAHNRVLYDPEANDGLRFDYTYSKELSQRTEAFRDALQRTIGRRHRMLLLSRGQNLNFGHACGTCRFGDDAQQSVLDKNNRVHEVENLYVVDASFFPSSGGTNPSLTIAANALRVADILADELGAPAASAH